MSDIAIRVDGVGKRYLIGERERFTTLREAFMDGLYAPVRGVATIFRNQRTEVGRRSPSGYIWALQDISFEIKRGDVFGVIGQNGAGKSTLLKILSRITEPTVGCAQIRGRVGSLLEIGTGFHPELTGRENIYFNGAILGMKKAEIERKFDEIVAFAEMERFLDTPVKHYSSGMYLRLAFAVAAYLEPEILLVDEVLAVGDVHFQQKCLGKMGDVAQQGRTVLFVSHNMGAIIQLCPKAILIRSGHIEAMGDSSSVVSQYLSANAPEFPDVSFDSNSNPDSPMVFTRCWIGDDKSEPIGSVDVTRPFTLSLRVLVRREVHDADIAINVSNGLGQTLFSPTLSGGMGDTQSLTPGEHIFIIKIPGQFLAPDTYSLTIVLHRPGMESYDSHSHILTFRVEEAGSNMWKFAGQRYGNILVHFPWEHIQGAA